MKDVRIRKINNIQMEQAMKEFIHKIHLNSKKKRIYKSRKKNINYKEEEDEIVEEESIEDLDKIRGIFGTKFHIDNRRIKLPTMGNGNFKIIKINKIYR